MSRPKGKKIAKKSLRATAPEINLHTGIAGKTKKAVFWNAERLIIDTTVCIVIKTQG